MSELETKAAEKTPQGGGGSKKKRGKQQKEKAAPRDPYRCRGRLPTGRRCKAARLRHSLYCVFHDPAMHLRRRRLAEPVPYEFADELQRLLGEVAEAVRKKKLSAKAGNTVGYLATLLMQNQPRVEKERERVDSAQYYAEMGAVTQEALEDRWQAQIGAAQGKQEKEDNEEEERD